MEPVAEYVETRPGGSRTYRLYPDTLSFRSRGIGLPDMEIEFPLADLSPTPAKIVLPAANFGVGLSMFVGFSALAAWFTYVCRSECPREPLLLVMPGIIAAAAATGLAAMVRSRHRIVHLHFYSASGLTFDLVQRGKFKDRFDGFVATLMAEIEKVRREKAPVPPAGT